MRNISLLDGKSQRENCATFRVVVGNQIPAMGLSNFTGNRKPQAGAAIRARARFIRSIEAFENAIQVFLWDSGAMIPDRQETLSTANG